MPQRGTSVKPKAHKLMSETHTLNGDPPVTVHLKRSARARRLSLRVSRLDGRVTLTLPQRAPISAARAFAEERGPWIRKHLAAQPSETLAEVGASVPVNGAPFLIVTGSRNAIDAAAREIRVSRRAAAAPATVGGLLKGLARTRMTALSDRLSKALGRPYSKITMRDTRSRWGSCSAEGALMYSWRIVMAPPEVQEYLAAHEVAHLAEMNHGPRFWAAVEQLCPGFETERQWLKTEGLQLQRYRFRAD